MRDKREIVAEELERTVFSAGGMGLGLSERNMMAGLVFAADTIEVSAIPSHMDYRMTLAQADEGRTYSVDIDPAQGRQPKGKALQYFADGVVKFCHDFGMPSAKAVVKDHGVDFMFSTQDAARFRLMFKSPKELLAKGAPQPFAFEPAGLGRAEFQQYNTTERLNGRPMVRGQLKIFNDKDELIAELDFTPAEVSLRDMKESRWPVRVTSNGGSDMGFYDDAGFTEVAMQAAYAVLQGKHKSPQDKGRDVGLAIGGKGFGYGATGAPLASGLEGGLGAT